MARQDSGINVDLCSRIRVSKSFLRMTGQKIPRSVPVVLINVKNGIPRKFDSILDAASFLRRSASYVSSGRKDLKKVLESKVNGLKYMVSI